MNVNDLRPGDTVEIPVEAEVVARFDSNRVKLKWHSGEEIMHESDTRLNNE
jgi:hypothetical protein